MATIAVPHALTDRPDARERVVRKGEIRFEHVTFSYGRTVEQGMREELLRLGGHYAMLWKHQSGGFLPNDLPGERSPDAPLVLQDGPVDDMRATEQPEPNTSDEPPSAKT